jgi:UDP-N-acetylmuramoyl-tripeptide--D-alanyl-D-alanine ligase
VSSELDNIKELYRLFVQFPFISTDTRKIVPNALFFCLKGENYDGNQFVNEALEKGARYVICDKRYAVSGERYEICDMRYETIVDNKSQISNLKSQIIEVDDVLKTLQELAKYHRNQLKIPIIGITGTNGKTTTKELVAAVLSKKYATACTQGNLNNHIGVPLTLLSITKEDEIAVIEMGANHLGEIEELCHIAQPEYGLITNIGKAHLEGFGTIENIIETKTALYRAAKVLFVNVEDEVLRCAVCDLRSLPSVLTDGQEKGRRGERAKEEVIFYGNGTNISGSIVEMNPCLVVELFGNKIQTQLTGNYNLSNILGAAAIGRYFGVPEQDICEAIAEYAPQNNRSQIIKTETNTIIADYYNANPTSMRAALDNFLQIEAPHKLAVLGDMLELGENSRKEHQEIIDFCKLKNLDTIFIGEHFFTLKNNRFHFFKNVDEYNTYLKNNKIQNKFILLKGSRGIHLEEITLIKN